MTKFLVIFFRIHLFVSVSIAQQHFVGSRFRPAHTA